MKKMNTATKPRLFRSGKPLPVDILIADPSITVIEVGSTAGFLLAASCYDNAIGDLILDNVTWVRRSGQDTEQLIGQSLKSVALYRHGSGLFVAQDATSRRYLPQPSVEPYCVAFITKEQYLELRQTIEERASRRWLDLTKAHILELPGFSFAVETLVAPPDYANATTDGLDHGLFTV
jgi:hypothetical protein